MPVKVTAATFSWSVEGRGLNKAAASRLVLS
jgi:hypothetical protein